MGIFGGAVELGAMMDHHGQDVLQLKKKLYNRRRGRILARFQLKQTVHTVLEPRLTPRLHRFSGSPLSPNQVAHIVSPNVARDSVAIGSLLRNVNHSGEKENLINESKL